MLKVVSGVAYVALSLLMGFYGTKKGLPFWEGLVASLLLSPLVGFIVVIIEKDKNTGRRGPITWS